jgi:hypothetical protein
MHCYTRYTSSMERIRLLDYVPQPFLVPFLVIKIFGNAPSWFNRYKEQEIMTIGATPSTRYQFRQHLKSSFCVHRSLKCKKDLQLDCIFCALGICACKSCS